MSCCYLICFDAPYRHARHYLGFTKDPIPDRRIDAHRRGEGSRLIAVVNAAGIGWTVARVWKGYTRAQERALKKQGGASRLCPVCKKAGRVPPSRQHGKISRILVDTPGAAV